MPNWKKVVVSGSNAELNTLNVTSTGSFGGKLSVSNTSGDTLTLTKDTTEPSLRFEGDTDKDFVLNIEGEVFNVSQNDGSTDIFSLDHDTKKATFGGDILLSNPSSPKIELKDTTNNVLLSIYSQNVESIIGTYSNHPLQLFTNSNLALELDTSQNATFLGDVTSTSSKFISTSTSDGDYVRLYAGSGTGKWDIYGSGTDLRFSDNDTAGNIRFDTSVGIGRSPSALLHVYRSDTTSNEVLFENNGTGDAGLTLRSNENTNNHTFSFINFDGNDSADNNTRYASIFGQIEDSTAGAEDGQLLFTTLVSNSETQHFKLNSSGVTFISDVLLSTDSDILKSGTNPFRVYTNGGLALSISSGQNSTFEGSIEINAGSLSITADGSNATTLTESDTGNFAIDTVGNITLDTDNGNVMLKDGGSEFGRFSNSSQDFIIQNTTSDKDILFKGRDSATTFTALSLDMSEEGNATFSGNVDIGDGKKINFGAAPDFSIFHSSSTNVNHIQSLLSRQLTLNADIINLRSEANDASYVVVNNTASIFSGDITISNTTPSLTLTDTDNSTDVIFKSLGGVVETDASSHIFSIASNEKMRLDGNGLLGLGTTAPSNYNNNLNNFVIRDSAHVGMPLYQMGLLLFSYYLYDNQHNFFEIFF